jgi:osmotically-inducible protein OsmY
MTQHATDHDLKDAVERELEWTSDVDDDRIGVAVNDGAITLSGQVASYPEKAAAINAALRVRGVKAIADEVVVRHRFGPRADADIARAAAEAIDGTVVIPPESVAAAVRHHEITLTGTVAWQHQRVAAKRAVAAIHGHFTRCKSERRRCIAPQCRTRSTTRRGNGRRHGDPLDRTGDQLDRAPPG